MMKSPVRKIGLALLIVSAVALTACGASQPAPQPSQPAEKPAQSALAGTIQIDGSSTVFPITEAVAEEFQKLHKGVKVTVGVSGTGGGMKKFTAGEIDIADASRPIKNEEKQAAEAKGIGAVELPVAYDGLSVLVHKDNTWAKCLTVAELKKVWEPGSKVNNWNQIHPEFPNQELKLFGPGTDSGTFEYFTEEINAKAKASRSNYTASEDDNVLVQGIAGNKGALGYFGYAYYVENKSKLNLVAVDGGNGCVQPSEKTINDGTYKPLSRPIFIYPSTKSLARPEVKEFVRFYLQQAPKLVGEVGYVPLPVKMYEAGLNKIK